MWQSRVEIKGYSVAYFDHFAAFEEPYFWSSVKGGTDMRFVNLLDIHASMPLTEVQRYGASNAAMWSKFEME